MDDLKNRQNITKNISNYISETAKKYPEKAAVLHPEKISFKEFQSKIDQLVSGLAKKDVKKGDKVLMLVKPGPQMFIITFSLLRIGAIPVMIDPGMGPKAMINAISKLVIDVFIGEPKAHILRIIYPNAFRNTKAFITTGSSILGYAYSTSTLQSGKWEESHAADMKPDDEAAIFFTSGSTGPAKAVLYQNSMFQAQINVLNDQFQYKSNEVDCCTFPLTGLLAMCLGLSIVFADMNMTKPAKLKPKKLIKNIQDYNCSHMFCSPMVLRKLAEHGKINAVELPSLKRVMTAGAPVPGELIRDFKNLLSDDAKIHTPYGATEALPISDITGQELLSLYADPKFSIGAVCIGYPLHEVNIKIIDIRDDEIPEINQISELPLGQVGEIIVKGPMVTQQYLSLENTSHGKIFDKNDNIYWHRMGDLGKKDEEGRIWFYGRKNHRVTTKEGLLFTIPVEAVFNTHPKVFRSALVAMEQKNSKYKKAIICIQLHDEGLSKGEKDQITNDLMELAKGHELTIHDFRYFKNFPVDPRHNAKIFREKLTKWVQK